jgi:hypothetical protein
MNTHGNQWARMETPMFLRFSMWMSMAWKIPTTRINLKKEYTPVEAVELLGVTVETIKAYCRNGTLKHAYQVGPRKEWRVRGGGIKKLRDQWKRTEGD